MVKKKYAGSFIYRPTITQEEFSASVARDMISSVINDPALFSAAAFTGLSDVLDKESIEKLKKLVSKL